MPVISTGFANHKKWHEHRRTAAVEQVRTLVMRKIADSEWQDAFAVLRTLSADPDIGAFAVADDLMGPPISVFETDDLHTAVEKLLECGARELIVTDATGRIVGFLDDADVTRAYHGETA